jgi:hypothetical protein
MPSNSRGCSRLAPLLDGVGGQLQQDLTGEGAARGLERRQTRGYLAQLQTAGDARQRHPDRRGPVLGRGAVLLRHQPRPYLGWATHRRVQEARRGPIDGRPRIGRYGALGGRTPVMGTVVLRCVPSLPTHRSREMLTCELFTAGNQES